MNHIRNLLLIGVTKLLVNTNLFHLLIISKNLNTNRTHLLNRVTQNNSFRYY